MLIRSPRSLIVCSIVVFLLFGEALCRLYFPSLIGIQYEWDAELGLIPKPGASGRVFSPWLFSFSFHHDPRGFRNTGAHGIKKRIMLVGDSMVYGIGVDDEESFPYRLQTLRSQDEILNAGAPGRGPDFYLRYLQSRMRSLRPDEVWVFFTGYNDWLDSFETKLWKVSPSGRLTPVMPQSSERGFLSSSRFFVIANRVVSVLRGKWRVRKANERNLPNPGPELFEAGKRFLCETDSLLRMSHVKHRFFFLPGPREVEDVRAGKDPGTRSAFRVAANNCGFEWTDLTEPLEKYPGPTRDLFNLRDFHFTPRGNEIVADILSKVSYDEMLSRR